MEIWAIWLDALRGALQFLSSDIGLGAGMAVVVLTILLRTISTAGLLVRRLSWLHTPKEGLETKTTAGANKGRIQGPAPASCRAHDVHVPQG